ncbi:ABC transporter ATP-binding protein [Streptomyces sp. NPDC059496]|uniref:ABC transporter ATP-binding protein n=1 Tax=Streptomyces sp. NPDC059496 TaxID=3346851 RepID=UPI003687D64D
MNETRASALRLLWRESHPVRPVAAGALVILMASVLATLAGPWLVQYFVNRATAGSAQSVLMMVAVWYLVVAVVAGAARIWASYLAVHSGWRIADSLRSRLLRHVAIERPVLEVESRPVGEVLEQVEGNANIVGKAIAESGFRMVSNVALVIGTIIAMSLVVPVAGVAISVLVVAVCFLLTWMARRSVRRWEVAREQQAGLFGFVGDSLAARDDLLLMRESQWAADRTHTDLEALLRTEGRAYISGRAFWPVTQLCFALAFGLGFGFGLRQLEQGAISIGTLTMIYLYVDLLQRPLEEMSSQLGQMQQMMAVLKTAARRLGPERSTAAPAKQAELPTLPEGPLEVAFEGVSFGYGDTKVLSDVSFTVAPGRSLGIVGPTGAGKSTVINLLCRLAEPGQGRVLIGGVEAGRLTPAQFAERVTVLSQRAHVFSVTVRENITLFDDSVPVERVWEVLEQLNAADWVRDLPEGLETRVGTGARELSDGEMQVLAGARVLIRPYSLLIVDEAASRFDPETERTWANLLDTVMRDRTVVMVEHRTGALRGVDQVMAMENGHVKEITDTSGRGTDTCRADALAGGTTR